MPQLRTCVTYLQLVLGCCCVVGELTMAPHSAVNPPSPAPPTATTSTTCPNHCMCELRTSPLTGSLKQTLDCRAASWTQVPDFENTSLKTEVVLLSSNHLHANQIIGLHTLSNLTELNLAENSIYSVENLRIDVDGLLYLLLDHNEIDYLPNRSFMSSPNLIFLSLLGNKIEVMHEQAFDGLYTLQTLDLTGNRIYELNIEWFRSLRALRLLRLHDNNVHVIQPNAFRFLHSLKTLDLSQNHIEHIYPGAFDGLEGLHQLDLQTNHLTAVPTQSFSVFRSLRRLDLSRNYVARLEPGAIANINVSVLLLTHMPLLLLIDQGAISSMPTLTAVALNDNPHLTFVDGRALTAAPNVNALHLHGGNLSVVEEALLQELPALKQLSFYANKLHCDCNVLWLVRELRHHGRNLSITSPEDETTEPAFVCASPPSLAGALLSDERLLNLPETCPPRILALFPREYNTEFGASVVMDCRATGIPAPQTDWLLPGAGHGAPPGEVVLVPTGGKSPRPHVQVSASGSLLVDYVQAVDQGQYVCLASNPHGRDERSTRINVTNIHANVIVMRITAHAITVTWRSTRHTHDYQILYRESRATNVTYQVIDIKPYMRSYTVSALKAETQYEFCIAVQHASLSVRINCTHVSTQDSDYLEMSIFDSRDYIIGGSIAGFIFVGLLICVLTHVVRRYNNRQRQLEELYTDNLSQLFLASMDSMSDTTPITYENRVAEMFDDDDIDEIRNTASMASTSAGRGAR